MASSIERYRTFEINRHAVAERYRGCSLATLNDLKRERIQAARATRRLQRDADTAIEKLERRLDTLILRKTIIDTDAVMTLVPLYNDFITKVRTMEKGMADFIDIVVGV